MSPLVSRSPPLSSERAGAAFICLDFLFIFFIVEAQWREKQRQRGGEGGRGGKTMSRREAVTEDNKGRGGEPVRRLRLRQGGVQATGRSREHSSVAGRTLSRK